MALIHDSAAQAAWVKAFKLGTCGGQVKDSTHKYRYTFEAGLIADGSLIIHRTASRLPLTSPSAPARIRLSKAACLPEELPAIYSFCQGAELTAQLQKAGSWPQVFLAEKYFWRIDMPAFIAAILEKQIDLWSLEERQTLAAYLAT